MKKKFLICVAVVGGLLAARQLNTVPVREWDGFTKRSKDASVRTVNDLFGSSYRGFVKGEDIGISSKNFSDILCSVEATTLTPKEKAERAAEEAQRDIDWKLNAEDRARRDAEAQAAELAREHLRFLAESPSDRARRLAAGIQTFDDYTTP
jgi:hypothetical protein